ncbi:hypothetical protein BDD12DRAFT_4632 [Trichophaea hybrida]|nr:hypothetical protein BDD12DRAFT_4632 [Trichophaea hybrida]
MPIPSKTNSSSHTESSFFSLSGSASFNHHYQETNYNYTVTLSALPSSPSSRQNSHCSSSSLSRHQRPRTLPPHRQPELQSLEQQPPPTKKMSLYPMRLYSSERPPSPLALTSSIAPPSLMPTTATASSPRSKRSANLKLSMLPNSSSSSSSSPSSSSSTSYHHHHHSHHSHHNNHKYNYAHSLSTQQKLQLHQREIITSATRANGIPAHLLSSGPLSPRLIPLGSPGGAVTPLMLEQEKDGSYFAGHELQYATAAQSQCS